MSRASESSTSSGSLGLPRERRLAENGIGGPRVHGTIAERLEKRAGVDPHAIEEGVIVHPPSVYRRNHRPTAGVELDTVRRIIPLGLFLVLVASALGDHYFRDEFYYLACSHRLAWGYVDHPPLSVAILWLCVTWPAIRC